MHSHPVPITPNLPVTPNLPATRTMRSKSGCKLFNETVQGAHRAGRHSRREKGCDHHEPADDAWHNAVHGELPTQRLNRTYAEILQEVRVAQTGVQCLLAFVLTLAFTPRFSALTSGELYLYVATLVTAALAASLLMAPAAFNRMVFQSRLRRRMVTAANRFAFFGLATLLGALGCAIMLILQVVLGSGMAMGITVTIITWCVLIWFAVPAWWRYRHRGCGSNGSNGADLEGQVVERHTPMVEHHSRPATAIHGAHPRLRRQAARAMEISWQSGAAAQSDMLRAHWRVHYVVRRESRMADYQPVP